MAIVGLDAPLTQGMNYPLALRNQPQWLEIGAFLVSQKFRSSLIAGARVIAAAAAEGAPACGEGSAAAAAVVRSIPVGNHGDNLQPSQAVVK
jgi:hypothetical protein